MNSKRGYRTTQFFRANPNDPLGVFGATIANGFLNIGINYGLQRVSREAEKYILGPTQSSAEGQFKQDSYRIALQKQESELAKSKLAVLKAAAQIQLLENKLQQKAPKSGETQKQSSEFCIQQTEVDFHMSQEIIRGTLNIAADTGVISSIEQSDAAKQWQGERRGKIHIVFGARGTGKTATGVTLGEFVAARYNAILYWFGVPKVARELLPSWIRIVNDITACPNDAVILCDEAALHYLSLHFQSKNNTLLRTMLTLCRQKNWTIIFCCQSSRDIDQCIIRAANCYIFKELNLIPEAERPEIRSRAIKAAKVFSQIPKEQRKTYAMVFDDSGFEGLIRTPLPTFWTEELSTIYGKVGTLPSNQGGKIIDSSGTKRDLRNDVTDEEIRALRRQGYGIEKIQKILNCSSYRVRQCLADNDPLEQ